MASSRRVATVAAHIGSAAAASVPVAAASVSSVINPHHHTIAGYTIIISGASRGIGLAFALAAARRGANIAVLGKTASPNPRLPGTIYSAKAEIEAVGGRAEAIQCDVRDEAQVDAAVAACVARFGGIDVVFNNASAISLTTTDQTPLKRWDLMHSVNGRGTFLLTAKALPYLRLSARAGRFPHILNNSPPLSLDPKWFGPHVAYSIAKFNMSLCTLGHAEEFRADGIAVNSLWPRTAIATAAVANLLGGAESVRRSRHPEIMADAAVAVLSSPPATCSGFFFIDDEVLRAAGVVDFAPYRVDPACAEADLMPDFFV